MAMLEQNLAILKTRFPHILQRIQEDATTAKPVDYRLLPTAAKKAYLKISQQNRVVHPYGQTNPEQVVQRWIHSIDTSQNRLFLLPGFGLGLHISALLRTLPKGASLLVYEWDVHLLKILFSRFDFSSILKDWRFSICVPGTEEVAIRRLNIELALCEGCSVLYFQPLYLIGAPTYSQAIPMLMKALTARWQSVNTDLKKTRILTENTYINFPSLHMQPDASCLEGCFPDSTVILVGAGPSLDESIEFLRQVGDSAVIVVVNSAFRKLVNSGVKPHLTVAVDPLEYTDMGYRRCDTGDVSLVASWFVYPQTLKRFNERVFAISSHNAIIEALRDYCGLRTGLELLGDDTVSATVMHLAAVMGCCRVCLCGQDFAFTKDGATHTADSFYTDLGMNEADVEDIKELPGNCFKKVPTDSKLAHYHARFEDLITRFKDRIQFINISRTGAKVSGAAYMEPGEALEFCQQGRTYDFTGCIRERLLDDRKRLSPNRTSRFFNAYLKYLDGVIAEGVKLGITLDKFIFQATAQGSGACDKKRLNYEMCNEFTRLNERFRSKVNSQKRFLPLLHLGKMKELVMAYEVELKRSEVSEPQLQQYAAASNYAWAAVEGAVFHQQLIHRHVVNSDSSTKTDSASELD